MHEYLMHAVYFAPRGKKRLMLLGVNVSQRYLSPEDRLVGLIGDAGAGKSLLIRGMFPGLELTNDDDGINIRPLPLLADAESGHFRAHTYHVDVRFETAFAQVGVLAEAVKKALLHGRRVVVEHFELLHPCLQVKPDVLIGVGEEVIVTRPGVFGPDPQEIAEIVFHSIAYRKMAHSAEDLTGLVLESLGFIKPEVHSDIKHGFVLEFQKKPAFDLEEVERRVQAYIARDEEICYYDDEHIKIGERIVRCTGPRIHVRKTGEITGFHLLKEFRWDPIQKLYTMAGLVGNHHTQRPGQSPYVINGLYFREESY
ncbi:lantibiotic ABC transporter [Clostridiales bacterium PH28_bin88]|nr:lantibiotic ABC transporter [Clostridiales bacterium PH28_bin88]